ncbi:site-2 protease family protein [Marinoscillum sp. MHG1-6]|uniref:site-2 protease family protein n=1 Tax=Marinoscillum sp. MHG1-6 TaxID=2959627 RepID=UPI00215808F1|nr:site-2 protease family protein [Marinoscillum sp. MHG1-6]
MNKEQKTLLIQIGLLVVTIFTTTLAGVEWMFSKWLFFVPEDHLMTLGDFNKGFMFSLPFLGILTVHEFGHYFTARYHRIKVTLPFYIPFWLGFFGAFSLGTMGAFIRIKDKIRTRKHYFDVGVSGPLAGFVIALGVIYYAYTHLPPMEYIFEIHPEYEQFGADYKDHVYTDEFARQQHFLSYQEARQADSLAHLKESAPGEWTYPDFEALDSYGSFYFNKPLLFILVEKYLVKDTSRIPGVQEIMHYPYLLAGLLALFFTALNLLPIGQLDGGHVVFGLFGEKNSRKISLVLFTAFLFYAGLGIIDVRQMHDTSFEGVFTFVAILLGYLYFLYICAYSIFESRQDRFTYAAVIMALQFTLHTMFGFEGYSGWLLFGLFLGRFIGIYHPPVLDNRPISLSRKILGWIALIVFVLSFSPEPIIVEI